MVVGVFVTMGRFVPKVVKLGVADTDGEFEEEIDDFEENEILELALSENVDNADCEFATTLALGKIPLAEVHCDALTERLVDKVTRGDCDVDIVI
jgi:hypothetical protein